MPAISITRFFKVPRTEPVGNDNTKYAYLYKQLKQCLYTSSPPSQEGISQGFAEELWQEGSRWQKLEDVDQVQLLWLIPPMLRTAGFAGSWPIRDLANPREAPSSELRILQMPNFCLTSLMLWWYSRLRRQQMLPAIDRPGWHYERGEWRRCISGGAPW